MSTATTRGPYQGVLQILQFNRRMYLIAIAGIVAAALAWPFLPTPGRIALLSGVVPGLFWMGSSMLVSHYIYDRFPLYDFRWIVRLLNPGPRRWINIHSGWDETSGLLEAIFPAEGNQVVDIFDPRIMTEISIQQARLVNQKAVPAISGRYDRFPFDAGMFDAAFAIFSAHELRRHEQRVDLFREIVRVLVPGGELVLMEHARDWKNFLAFGPGFLHFFSRKEWRNAASEAGLVVRTELAMTPFVHVWVLRKNL
jgi:SAM-dependent methyltransferase